MGKTIWAGLLVAALGGSWVITGCNPPEQEAATTPKPSPTATTKSTEDVSASPEEASASDEPQEIGLHLFVPCGMIIPFNALRKVFEKEHGIEVEITYDNGVVLVRKIRKGQRPDILITPGVTEMEITVQEDFIAPNEVTTFGTFELVVVVPKANKAGITSVQDLAEDRVRSIAMADPEENSVGYYAEQALKNLGMWEAVEPKLKKHWHALTAVNYVCQAKVDAGIYYRACPFDTAPEKLEEQFSWKFAGDVPPEAYPQIEVQAGILKEASHRDMAEKFIAFLQTEETQALLAEKGLPNFE